MRISELARRAGVPVRPGRADRAREEAEPLQPLWDLFARHGSLRVIAAVAAEPGLAPHASLPRPLRGLPGDGHRQAADVLRRPRPDV
ncbi:hypothetical protein ABT215_22975 [Streptomyces sp900105755]|uniref:hypothetical protein n=1 Tax=unclassified Streptomyces TaxID=2593676 RepID=UPI000AC185F3|nr:hypothetical protein [Streptomyces sp. Ag109_O5-10]